MGLADSKYLKVRRGLLAALLWAGLIISGFALVRYWAESRSLIYNMGGFVSLLLFVTLVAVWAIAVISWQHVLRAYSGRRVSATVASRHLALLLLGKYLPGGIWGFVARLTDSAMQQPVARMLAAGVAEQWLGLATLSLVAALGLLAAQTQETVWLWMTMLIPVIAVVSLLGLHSVLRSLDRKLPARWSQLQTVPSDLATNSLLWTAAGLLLLQQILILAMVALVANPAFMLDAWATLAIASSYGVAVVAGVLVVFMPGGIGVREVAFVALSSAWISSAEAIALAAVLRLLFTVFDLLAGVLAGGLRLRETTHD